MAELAGSVVGIVAFGAYTLESSIKLKQLWTTIKNAPEDVQHLIDETINLSSLLAALKQQHDAFAPLAVPSPVWDDCRQRCSSVATDLESVAADLRQKIQRWKPGGSIRVLFKKDVVAKHTTRLASAKTNLLLAQSSFNSSIQLQQLAQSFKQSSLLASIQAPSQHPSEPQLLLNTEQVALQEPTQSADSTMPSSQLIPITYESKAALARRVKREKESRSEYLIKSQWLGKLFQIQVNTHYEWGITVIPWTVLPNSAPIWKILNLSDLDGLRHFLSSGTAWLYTVNEWGQTLLDHAAQKSSLEVVQTLLQEGACPTKQTLELCYGFRVITGRAETSLARLLIAHSTNLLIEQVNTFVPTFGFSDSLATLAEPMEILLQSAFPPYYQRSLGERLQNIFSHKRFTDDDFYLWLGQNFIDSSCLYWAGNEDFKPRSLLPHVAEVLGRSCAALCFFDRRAGAMEFDKVMAERKTVIAQIVKAGGVDAAHERGESILVPCIEYGVRWMFNSSLDCLGKVNLIARLWLKALGNAGVDLETFSVVERRLWLRQRKPLRVYGSRWPELTKIEFLGLCVGPQPEDWQIYFPNPLDEWTADFWHLIEEGPEQSLPGSWIDDDEEDQAELRARPGRFKSLATSRRKRRRYLRMMGLANDEARENLGSAWTLFPMLNSMRRAEDVVEFAGIEFRPPRFWPQLGDLYGKYDGNVGVYPAEGGFEYMSIEKFCLEHCQG